MYTSVLPLPVMPRSRNAAPGLAATSAASASRCAGVGTCARRRRNGAREERIAHHLALRERDESALRERADHRWREAELRGEMRGVARAAERFQRLVERALPRRAREHAVALLERWQLHAESRDALRARRGARHARTGERRRQHCAQYEPHRRHEVVRDPAREREQLGGHARFGVGRVENVLGVLHALARRRPEHYRRWRAARAPARARASPAQEAPRRRGPNT